MLLVGRDYYKPLRYPFAFEYFNTHEKMHWLPEEVPLEEDVKDWNFNLTPSEKNLLTQLFRFFTQADVDVAEGYTQKFLPLFGNTPEIAMMMASFAAREAVHIHAYSLLLDTIGMDEEEYRAFQEYEEMKEKHEYLEEFDLSGKRDLHQRIAKAIAVYSGFTEGMQLFSSFIILLNFTRFGKMKGMGQIVSWSVRDESLHVEAMITLFKTFVEEYADRINKKKLERDIGDIATVMVSLEDKFIDLAFSMGDLEGLDKNTVKKYIRYIADRRMNQLGFEPIFFVENNPLPEDLIAIMNGSEHTNFFENRATDYSKGNIQGDIVDWS